MIALDCVSVTGRERLRLDSVSIDFSAGAVHALIGPNGAGKSTLLAVLAGYLRPTAGDVAVTSAGVLRRRAAVLDADTMHPSRTVRETLRLRCMALGVSRTEIDVALRRSGLADVARRKVGRLSLGMRTRLAIAAALIADPDVLLFDEPLNGLDPDGIDWVRRVLAEARARGACVVVSSHLLSELERVSDTVTLMSRGRVFRPRSEPCGGLEGMVRVRASPTERVTEVLATAGLPARDDAGSWLITGVPSDVARLLVKSDIDVHELVPERGSFEILYSDLTSAEHLSSEGR